MTQIPAVTVIMPVRNEADFIGRSLGAVLQQDYPADRLEILVVDGMSEDSTREQVQLIVEEASPLSRVTVMDNPDGIVPHGLNLGLKEARGEVIIRIDGHCIVPHDYVSRLVDLLQRTGADCVGGVLLTEGTETIAAAAALAQSSRFGVGSARFRTGGRSGEVDTVAFGAYRREIFDRVGGFDEELVRNQDDEFNLRLVRSGGRIWFDPTIEITYFARSSFRRLWHQYLEYGLFKVRVIQKHRRVSSLRQLAPPLLVCMLCGSLLASLFGVGKKPLFSVWGVYFGTTAAAGGWTARRRLQLIPFVSAAFVVLHIGYGTGFLWGVWRWRDGWWESSSDG